MRMARSQWYVLRYLTESPPRHACNNLVVAPEFPLFAHHYQRRLLSQPPGAITGEKRATPCWDYLSQSQAYLIDFSADAAPWVSSQHATVG